MDIFFFVLFERYIYTMDIFFFVLFERYIYTMVIFFLYLNLDLSLPGNLLDKCYLDP